MPTTMLPQAKKLAKDPPVALFKQIVDHSNPYVANQGTLVWDWLVKRDSEDYANSRVGSTCDLNALSMMCIGMGTKRYADMITGLNKEAHKNKWGKLYDNRDNGGHEHAYRFNKDKHGDLSERINEWCGGEGNGVMQLKFSVGSDWHTLTVERVAQDDNKPNVFVVYQAYQATYRLHDFLGDGNADDSLKKLLDLEVAHTIEQDNPLMSSGARAELLPGEVDKSLKRLADTVKTVGGGQMLSLASLDTYINEPVITMLKGGLDKARYVLLSASGTKKDTMTSEEGMGVLFADKVTVGSYSANYEALIKPAEEVTMYPDLMPE